LYLKFDNEKIAPTLVGVGKFEPEFSFLAGKGLRAEEESLRAPNVHVCCHLLERTEALWPEVYF
jgi:hypothetical protein